MTGVVDYLCNAFTPERRDDWERVIAAQRVQVKIRPNGDDGFTSADELVARMDQLGVDTIVVTTGDEHHSRFRFDYHHVTNRWEETEQLVKRFPGRFAALWVIDPDQGMGGVARAAEALDQPWFVGVYNHVHSFDRPFDHADFYPFYALCNERQVPVVMQAGSSGGLAPSECGRPIGIDRPAIYFPDTNFLLSHTGWPWVAEAIAMALKHSNVYLGTAAYPPRHWPPEVIDFVQRLGRRKTIFGTNFPTVGHRQALSQFAELELDDDVKHLVLEENARRLFTRLP